MKLEENEYTIKSLIDMLNKKFTKASKKKFNHSDISQYCIRGYLPYKYGGQLIETREEHGVKIITLKPNENETK